CDAGYAFFIRFGPTTSIRLADDKKESAAIPFPATAWAEIHLTYSAPSSAAVTIGGTTEPLILSQPCVHPKLSIGVLPGTGQDAFVRYDEITLTWWASK